MEERWTPRGADEIPELTEVWWGRAVVWAVVLGVGFALLGAVLVGIDFASARGVTGEHVRVEEVRATGERTSCGYRAIFNNADEFAYEFAVIDPRPGFPASFEVRGCPGMYDKGFTGLVARKGPHGEDTLVDPPTAGRVAMMAGVFGGAVGGGTLAFWLVVDGVRSRWARRRRAS